MRKFTISKKASLGFTMIELLIIVGILTVLIIAFTISMRRQRLKAEDAEARENLHRLQIALEDYHNDNNCYPPIAWFNTCGGNDLNPYIHAMPCQPNGQPFVVEYDATGCRSYRIYTYLHIPEDPINEPLWVNDGTGVDYDYGVSSGGLPILINAPNFYCQAVNNCTSWPINQTCSPSYTDPNCGGGCTAAKVGSCN